jgi:hypothetical protein
MPGTEPFFSRFAGDRSNFIDSLKTPDIITLQRRLLVTALAFP